MILLYADDPGGANYLAPLTDALSEHGISNCFVIAPALVAFAADRGFTCVVRANTVTAEGMLNDVSLLVVGTSEDKGCFAHKLVDVARARNITSLGVVDMGINADRRFRGFGVDPLRHAPDWLAVTDESSAVAFTKIGFPVDHLLVCGHPLYDKVRTQRLTFLEQDLNMMRQCCYPEAPAGRPIWLFLAEGIDQLNPEVSFRSPDYTLHGRGVHDFRGLVVLEEVLDAAAELDPRPWVVLRLHPKNKLEDFRPLTQELGMVSQTGDPLPLVWAADLVIGMTTMLLIETYLLGRPHLAVLPRISEKTWLYTTSEGLTQTTFTREELRAFLSLPYEKLVPQGDMLPKDAVKILLSILLGSSV